MTNRHWKQLKLNTLTSNENDQLKAAVFLVNKRTGFELDVLSTVTELVDIFPNEKLDHVLGALKNGSTGMYGSVYKLSLTELCVWVRKYKESIDRQFDLGICQ